MRKGFIRFADALAGFTSLLLTVIMLIMVALAFYQVLTRFIFHDASPWTEEILRRAMIWMVTLGLALGFRHGAHISVDVIARVQNRLVQRVVPPTVFIISLLFLLTVVWLGSDMAYRVRFQTFGSLDISMFWAYLAIPAGAALSVITLIAHYLSGPDQKTSDEELGGLQCQV
ncbi:MAG: TRAP transporter small permease [Burkholderiaceae bacterium]|nr:TRAP transporter small permease [Burkholderiaceae bacterium]